MSLLAGSYLPYAGYAGAGLLGRDASCDSTSYASPLVRTAVAPAQLQTHIGQPIVNTQVQPIIDRVIHPVIHRTVRPVLNQVVQPNLRQDIRQDFYEPQPSCAGGALFAGAGSLLGAGLLF